MKRSKNNSERSAPPRMSAVETPLCTGQYPAFGIENPEKLPPAERKKRKQN